VTRSVRVERRAMATSFEVVVRGEQQESFLRAAAEEALDEIERLEAQLSIYMPQSEISAINAARGPVGIEPRLYALLLRMREISLATGGAFDGGIKTARFTKDTVAADDLDLGGIGKGYALDRAAKRLKARGITEALLHGGTSTVVAMGEWRVGLVDPRDDTRRFGSLTLTNQALAVSSNLADRPGHIPAGNNVAAWAICDNPTDADAFSTAFLVAGPQEQPGVSCMVLTNEGLECLGIEPERHDETRFGLSRRSFMKTTAAVVSLGALPARRAVAQGKKPKPKARIALVGVGEQGKLLLAQLKRMQDVEIPAVCDVSDAALKDAIKIVGRDVETYEDVAQLLDEEQMDGIVVATPTHLHTAAVLAALKAKVPVFVEAPLAHVTEDCKKIVAAAKEHNTVVHVGHQRRSSTLYPHLLEHLKSGAIGDLLQVRAQINKRVSWRRPGNAAANWRLDPALSGGLLLEWGCHIFDLFHWYSSSRPRSVSGIGSVLKWKDRRNVDDSVQVIVEYAGGLQLNLGLSLLSTFGGEREVLVGSAATVLIRDQRKGLLFKESDTALVGWEEYASKEMRDGRRGIILDPMATKYKQGQKKTPIGPDAGKLNLLAEMKDFLAAVRGPEPTKCSAYDGLVAAVTALKANQAIEQRKTLRFTDKDFEV